MKIQLYEFDFMKLVFYSIQNVIFRSPMCINNQRFLEFGFLESVGFLESDGFDFGPALEIGGFSCRFLEFGFLESDGFGFDFDPALEIGGFS